MAIFDPNQGLPDFQQQQLEVDRQRRIAEFLRKKPTDQPEMRMSGRVAVQPHWLERLIPLLNQYQAGVADRNATGAEQDMSNQQSQAANQWRGSLPQATPAMPYQEGSPDVPGLQDGTAPTIATPAVPVDRSRILKYTLEGLNNPRTAKEAAIVNQSLTSDLQRDEDKTFKTDERKAQDEWRAQESALTREAAAAAKQEQLVQAYDLKKQQLEFQHEQLKQRSQDATLTREQQLTIAKMMDATRQSIAAGNSELRLALADLASGKKADAKTAADDKAAFTKDKETQRQIEHYGTVVKDLVPLHQSMQAVQTNLDKYDNDPKKVPGLGYNLLLPSVAQKAEANRVQRQFRDFSNSVMRGDAGLSQTLSEQANVLMQNMATGKFSTKEFVENWPEIMAKYNAKIKAANGVITPEALKTMQERGGYALNEVAAKPRADKSALPKSVAEQMPEGMNPASWARLQELRKNAAGGTK